MIEYDAKTRADRFIADQIAQYGLNGTNVAHNPPAGFPIVEGPAVNKLSVGQSFLFGYNGESFGFRTSSTCMFWTEHAKPRRSLEDIREEFACAAREVLQEFGPLKVLYTGRLTNRLVLEAFSRVTLEANRVEVVVPLIAENKTGENELERLKELYPQFRYRVLPFTLSQLERDAFEISAKYRGVNARQLLGLLCQREIEGTYLLDSDMPRLVDQNYDQVKAKQVGPRNICLEERESDFEAGRASRVLGTAVLPSFFVATPELLPAIVRFALENGRSVEGRVEYGSNLAVEFGISSTEEVLPEIWVQGLEERLRAEYPKSNEAWLTPSWCLLGEPSVEMEAVYGSVL
ncbi:MAG: hypothetical protein RBT63_09875 [Bdellovibrionales bacterium]|nr:hypothetical protein [Bdellovibrionales bacterium]